MDAHEYVKQLDTDGRMLFLIIIARANTIVAQSGRARTSEGGVSSIQISHDLKDFS